MAAGTAILGTAVLKAFLASLGDARLFMENTHLLWNKVPSVFAFLRLLGTSATWAYAVQFAVAVVAVIIVWRVWRHCRNRNLRNAVLMTATFLVSPYAFYYDLAWLAFPIAWLALDGLRNGWLRGEREVLVAAWLLPLMMVLIAAMLKVQVGPLVLGSLLWMTYRRATTASMTGAPASAAPAKISSRLYSKRCYSLANTSTMAKKSEHAAERKTMNADAHWLNRERLIFYSRIFLALFFGIGVGLVVTSKHMVTGDFVLAWAASHLALTGHALDAYSIPSLIKAQQIAEPGPQDVYGWFYPPSYYLLILPLALLPYAAAYWSFMLSTLGGYLLVFRRIIRDKTAMWCLAGFSGLWMNFFDGQNGFLTAALAGAALLNLERRPVLAGVFIGLLAIKPHLAMLFPVALLAIGAWRTLITAAVTAITFMAVGTAILGTAVLKAFLASLGDARHLCLENGSLLWSKMPSVFAFMRLLGTPVTWAYVAHFIVAVVAVIAVWRVWRNCQNRNLRGASLMTATFLVSPYVLFYDLAWLAFPIAWLALDGLRYGWQRGERAVLAAAWLLPLLMMVQIIAHLNVQVGPLVLCSLLWMTYRRATTASMTGAPASAAPAKISL